MPNRRIAAPSFGTTKRKDNFAAPKGGLSASVGPGYYKTETSPKVKLRTAFTFRNMDKEAKQEVSPGPGDYDTTTQDKFRARPRNARFTRTVRTQQTGKPDLTEQPGPGTYNLAPRRQQGPKWTFAKSVKAEKNAEVPNSHFYNIPSTFPNVAPYEVTRNMLDNSF
jgi:hypothetical protein